MRNSRLREQARLISAECLAVRIRLLNRIITNIYDAAMRPHGISLNQASILTLIMSVGDVGYGDIGRILHMEKSTVSRNIERMRNNGWIEAAGKGDRGVTVLSITVSGERVLKKAHIAWAKAQDEAAQYLGQDGVAAVMQLGEKFWPEGEIQEE